MEANPEVYIFPPSIVEHSVRAGYTELSKK